MKRISASHVQNKPKKRWGAKIAKSQPKENVSWCIKKEGSQAPLAGAGRYGVVRMLVGILSSFDNPPRVRKHQPGKPGGTPLVPRRETGADMGRNGTRPPPDGQTHTTARTGGPALLRPACHCLVTPKNGGSSGGKQYAVSVTLDSRSPNRDLNRGNRDRIAEIVIIPISVAFSANSFQIRGNRDFELRISRSES